MVVEVSSEERKALLAEKPKEPKKESWIQYFSWRELLAFFFVAVVVFFFTMVIEQEICGANAPEFYGISRIWLDSASMPFYLTAFCYSWHRIRREKIGKDFDENDQESELQYDTYREFFRFRQGWLLLAIFTFASIGVGIWWTFIVGFALYATLLIIILIVRLLLGAFWIVAPGIGWVPKTR